MEEKQVKHWLKENWFKLGVLIALIVLVSGVALYLNDKSKLAEQERLDKITRDTETKAAQEQAKILEQEKKDQQQQLANKVTATKKARIGSQIKEFEDFLENTLVKAGIYCGTLGVYYNLLLREQKVDWDIKETEEVCREKYKEIIFTKNKLVAEPELTNLREKLWEYIQEVEILAMHALKGGGDARILDNFDKNEDGIRMEAREEILRIKRQWGLN